MIFKKKYILFIFILIFTNCIDSNVQTNTEINNISVYDGLVMDYINENDRFINQPHKIIWTKEEAIFKGEDYQLFRIGFDTELRFVVQKMVYINKEFDVYEYDNLNDSLKFIESYGL